MSAVAVPVTRLAVRITITVVWALILSKLIRSAWALTKRIRNKFKKTSTTKK